MVRKMKRTKAEQRMKWWKLKEELKQAVDGQDVLQDNWTRTTNVIREMGKRVLGVTFGRKVNKETWR